MPLTPTERRARNEWVAAAKAPHQTTRYYVIAQRTKTCTVHKAGMWNTVPPTCGCKVVIATSRTDLAAKIATIRQAVRDYVLDLKNGVVADADGHTLVPYDQDGSGAEVADDLTATYVKCAERKRLVGKVITTTDGRQINTGRVVKDEAQDYETAPEVGFRKSEGQVRVDGLEMQTVQVSLYLRNLNLSGIAYATHLEYGLYAECVYCKHRNFRCSPSYISATNVADEMWLADVAAHYYACPVISRKRATKTKKDVYYQVAELDEANRVQRQMVAALKAVTVSIVE